ncbi:MAG: MC/SLC25 family protein [Legionella sp.]|uniref:MC/SLC25 family protein n=1 Tax=Legionella sp. TaxID=459 RepID=UPI00283D1B16|nr:MC/SLC25 family protein [Legionella sp.]
MKEKTEQTTSFLAKIAESPWVKGPVLGAGVMALVTPFLKWTNHAYKGEKMPRGNYFSGSGAYALSAVPGYATTFAFKALLSKQPGDTSQWYELFSSFAAGSLSGLVCTPFEALAQNKQLTHSPSLKETAQQMRTHHGYSSFFRGAMSVMLREGLWSTVYMTAIPMVSTSLQKQGVDKQYAQPLAMLMIAGAYGLFSSPLNQLRYRKQEGLTTPGANKSYLEHAKDIFNQDLKASNLARVGFFFRAAIPRALTTTVAAGLMVKGTEYYNQVVDSCKL